MAKISTSDLVPGMIVKKDIKDRNGRVLLNKDSIVKISHLRILKMWGVYEVDIVFKEDLKEKSFGENLRLEGLAKRLNARFCRSNIDNPCIKKLIKLLLPYENQMNISGLKNFIHNFPSNEDIEIHDKVTLEDFVNNEEGLSVFPDVFFKLMEVLDDPRKNASDIAKVIEKDPSLALGTLRLVNSSFYGFSKKIDSIYNAVIILGIRQLGFLAMGFSVIKTFKGIPSKYIDMKKLWIYSLAVGLCSKIIARQADCQDYNQIFVGGLIHDIGKLVILKRMPLKTMFIIKKAWEKDLFLFEAEKKYLGFTHCEVGAKICLKSKLPDLLTDIVKNHHNPRKSKFPLQCSVVHLAELIVNAAELGFSCEKLIFSLDDYSWGILGLSPNSIPVIIRDLKVEMRTVLEFLS